MSCSNDLDFMEIKENKTYHIKLIRLWEPEPKLIWQGKAKFHIQRRRNGDIGMLTPRLDDIPVPWAEYCQEDIEENGNCVCEDYLMEIDEP